jgi:hypothetical protein
VHPPTAGFCSACHSETGTLTGGPDVGEHFPISVGSFIPSNLTPSGLLKHWSDGETFRAVRNAVDGTGIGYNHVLHQQAGLSDDDTQAVIAGHRRATPWSRARRPARRPISCRPSSRRRNRRTGSSAARASRDRSGSGAISGRPNESPTERDDAAHDARGRPDHRRQEDDIYPSLQPGTERHSGIWPCVAPAGQGGGLVRPATGAAPGLSCDERHAVRL